MSSPFVPAVAPEQFVARIHASSLRTVLAVTGGGSGAISALLSVPGGSRTVLAATVPYSSTALAEWLGARPETFCSEHTARLMAVAGYQRAVQYAEAEKTSGLVVGVGCTASLASDRPKRGAHRIHVAVQTAAATNVYSLELVKGARTRTQEELIAARLILNALASAGGLPERLPLDLQSGEDLLETGMVAPPDWQELFSGSKNAVLAKNIAGRADHLAVSPAGVPARRTIFPGAFHPLHDGHRAMARVAQQRLGLPVEWEISIANVDKPALDFHEMRLRSEQFTGSEPLWLTRAPTFVEKSRLFPGATFMVGADTIERIAEARYYHGDPQAARAAIDTIAAAGCRFLVFGREGPNGFETLTNLALPQALRNICREVGESEFRADISSTALRQATAPEGQ